MKVRTLLLLTATLAALGWNGVATGTTISKKFSFPLSDAVITWGGDNVTVDGNSFTYNAGTNSDDSDKWGNAAMGWTTITDISDYTNLVLELEEATTSTVEIVVANGGFWGMNSNYTTTLTQGNTEISIPVASMTKNNIDTNNNDANGDGSALDLTKVDLIFLRTGWVHEQTIKIKDFYLEKVVEEAVVTDDTKEINISDPTQTSYDLDGETNYKYLVIVPSKPYVECVSNQFLYNLTDGTNSIQDWGFAYGYYQQRRASVINLNDKKLYATSENENEITKDFSSYGIDMTKLTRLTINSETSGTTLAISAIYFTNEKPTYDNRWNFPVEHYDYMREATTAGTYGTVCLPYNAAICGAETYKVVGVDSKDNPTKLYLEETYGLLKAGTPYIFKTNTNQQWYKKVDSGNVDGNGNKIYNTVTCNEGEIGDDGNKAYQTNFKESYVTFYKAGATTSDEPLQDDALVGNFGERANVPNTGYILKDGKWGKGANNTIGQYRAYLDISKIDAQELSSVESAKLVTMELTGNGTTGIKDVDTIENSDEPIFNLSGMRIVKPLKGIYIKGGKKIVIR